MKFKALHSAILVTACIIMATRSVNAAITHNNEDKFVVKVGFFQDHPKIYADEDVAPAGIFVDLLNKIAEEEGWILKYIPCDWGNGFEALADCEIDLMPDVAFSFSRNEIFDFNKTQVIESWSQVYSLPGLNISSLADLRGLRIAILMGSVQQSDFDRLMRGFSYPFVYVPANSFNSAFSMVRHDSADVVITNNYFGEFHYHDFGLVKTPVVFSPLSLHFATRKGSNQMVLKSIDRYLENWIKTPDSYYYKTLNKYLDRSDLHENTDISPWYFVILFGLLLTAMLLILQLRKKISLKTISLAHARISLRQERDKFMNYIENAPYGVFVVNRQGRYIEVNQAATRITGFSSQELLEKSLSDLSPGDSHQFARQHFHTVADSGKASGTFPFIRKDGQRRYWKVEAVKISNDLFLGFTEDVTKNINMVNELSELRKSLEMQVRKKTKELNKRIAELEHFRKVTIERELRMEELREEIKRLKEEKQG